MHAMDPRRVCVYAGSNAGADPAYAQAARTLGRRLAQRGLGLVYGGAGIGLMGEVADAVLAAGGEAIGVLPQALERRELAHRGLTELRLVDSMHERKLQMSELAGAFVALPGGLGTIEELAEALTWTQLGIHRKPVGLLDVRGYWDELGRQLDHAVRERFMPIANRRLVLRDASVDGLLDRLEAWRPAAGEKWLEPGPRALLEIGPRGPLVGASAVVVRDGRVLLGPRRGAHGAASWAFPGGKPDPGEAPHDAAVRELEEETGLVALDVRPIAWTNDVFADEGLHFVTLHHRVEVAPDAVPRRREPDKSGEWAWHAWDALPQPLFGPVAALAASGWRPGPLSPSGHRER
jgi:uncharacterized protein (TIGR00730 family)